MSKAKLGATCMTVLLSVTLASAQTTRGRAPDRSLPNGDAAKSAQTTTISGCVVRDAANGGQPTISVNGMSYQLNGKRSGEFDRYLGKRVEVTGAVDSGSSATRAAGGTAIPPKDQTATAGQADVPLTNAPRDNTAVPLATDKGTTADLTARIQVKTIRMVSPSCL
jgi:hypothetical protein